jgi:hypothetical protein
MSNRILMCVVMALVACKSDETRAYEAVAREVNPVFRALGGTFDRVLESKTDHDADLTRAVILACHTADALLERLRYVDLSKTEMQETFSPWVAGALDYREVMCRPGNALVRLERCATSCTFNFRQIAKVAAELRRLAKAHGVDIEPLGPVISPE